MAGWGFKREGGGGGVFGARLSIRTNLPSPFDRQRRRRIFHETRRCSGCCLWLSGLIVDVDGQSIHQF